MRESAFNAARIAPSTPAPFSISKISESKLSFFLSPPSIIWRPSRRAARSCWRKLSSFLASLIPWAVKPLSILRSFTQDFAFPPAAPSAVPIDWATPFVTPNAFSTKSANPFRISLFCAFLLLPWSDEAGAISPVESLRSLRFEVAVSFILLFVLFPSIIPWPIASFVWADWRADETASFAPKRLFAAPPISERKPNACGSSSEVGFPSEVTWPKIFEMELTSVPFACILFKTL